MNPEAEDEVFVFNAIAECAAFYSLNSVLQEISKHIKEESVTEVMRDRASFFDARNAVRNIRYPLDESFLADFLDLEEKLRARSLASGIPAEDWAEVRQLFTAQVVISNLLSLLGLKLEQTPTSGKQIALPNNFNRKTFVTEMKKTVDSLYRQWPSDDSEEDAKEWKKALLSSVTADLFKDSKATTLDAKKVFALLKEHSLTEMIPAVLTFYINLETKVLGLPQMLQLYHRDRVQPAAVAQELQEPMWTEDDVDQRGPYSNKDNKSGKRARNAPAAAPAAAAAAPVTASPAKKQEKVDVAAVLGSMKRKYEEQDPLNQLETGTPSKNSKAQAKAQTSQDDRDTDAGSDKGAKKAKRAASPVANTAAARGRAAKEGMASPTKKRSLLQSRPTGTKIDFEEDIGDFDSDDETAQRKEGAAVKLLRQANQEIEQHKRFGLPSPPPLRAAGSAGANAPRAAATAANAAMSLANTAHKNRDPQQGPRNRVGWSTAEIQALREGLRVHGHGHWALIKNDPRFGHILEQRTNVDLKDKVRTLQKNGELDDEEDEEVEEPKKGKTAPKEVAVKTTGKRRAVRLEDVSSDSD